jgi:hypothetical protein
MWFNTRGADKFRELCDGDLRLMDFTSAMDARIKRMEAATQNNRFGNGKNNDWNNNNWNNRTPYDPTRNQQTPYDMTRANDPSRTNDQGGGKNDKGNGKGGKNKGLKGKGGPAPPPEGWGGWPGKNRYQLLERGKKRSQESPLHQNKIISTHTHHPV